MIASHTGDACVTPTPWEHRLLEWAYDAFEGPVTLKSNREVDSQMLERAYHHCEDLIKLHSRTFYMASGLLSPDKRRAARALYAFCRISDDLVDVGFSESEESRVAEYEEGDLQDLQSKLDAWKQRALSDHPSVDDPVTLAWTDTRIRYRIPIGYAEQLIEGVARDLISKRYATFDDLVEYCYGVASTVGLMVMHIIGFEGPEAIPYAVKLGVALQLNNILRDVGEDWRAGRVYLPQDELAKFGLTEADIDAVCADSRFLQVRGDFCDCWRAFMRFQIERTRRLYDEALPGIALLEPDGRFAIAAAAELYRAILDDIEAHDGDVFHRRACVSTWGKLRRLPGIWWHSKTLPVSVSPISDRPPRTRGVRGGRNPRKF